MSEEEIAYSSREDYNQSIANRNSYSKMVKLYSFVPLLNLYSALLNFLLAGGNLTSLTNDVWNPYSSQFLHEVYNLIASYITITLVNVFDAYTLLTV